MVRVPERAAPVVAATEYFTVPFPEPLAPDSIFIQDALLLDVHAQPAPPVTLTLPLPPDEGTDCESGAIASVQPSPCVIVTVCPAIVTVPDRDDPVVPSIVSVTTPAPLPAAPPVIVIHEVLLAAVHPHPGPALTLTVRDPPDASTVCASGDTS
jgi:hypothetical protein